MSMSLEETKKLAPNATLLAIVNKDFAKVISDSSFRELNLKSVVVDRTIHWKMTIVGGAGTYWDRQVYDVEIQFNNKHPFEPPKVVFPPTEANKRSIKVPLLTSGGQLQLTSLNRDNWTPAKSIVDIINEIQSIFRSNPDIITNNFACRLNDLSVEVFHQLVSYLALPEIGSFSGTNKKFLVATYSNELWADLYYSRCSVPTCYVFLTNNVGPSRVLNRSGIFVWENSRDAYIRSKQCAASYRIIPHMETMIAAELSVLTDVAFPALYSSNNAGEDTQPLHVPMQGQHNPAHFMAGGFGQLNHNAGVHAPLLPGVARQHNEAIKYRLHRSRRMVRWLVSLRHEGAAMGIHSSQDNHHTLKAEWNNVTQCDAFINRFILHNRWNTLPMTALQFLCSLESNIRPGSNFEHLTQALMMISRRNASRLQSTMVALQRMLSEEGLDLLASAADATSSNSGNGYPSLMSTISSFLGHGNHDSESENEEDGGISPYNSKKQRHSFDLTVPSAYSTTSHVDGQGVSSHYDRVLSDEFLSRNLHAHDEEAIETLNHEFSTLTMSQEARSERIGQVPWEDIESFVNDLSLNERGAFSSSSAHEKVENNGSNSHCNCSCSECKGCEMSTVEENTLEPVAVPDIYDFVERLHEMTIACNYHFRLFNQNTIMDCQDSSGDWLEACVNGVTKVSAGAEGQANNHLFNNNLQNLLGGNFNLGGSGLTNPFLMETKIDRTTEAQAKYLEKLIAINEKVHHASDSKHDGCEEASDSAKMDRVGYLGQALSALTDKVGVSSDQDKTEKLPTLLPMLPLRSNTVLSPYWICTFCTAANRLTTKVCTHCLIYCARPLRVNIPVNSTKMTKFKNDKASAQSMSKELHREEYEKRVKQSWRDAAERKDTISKYRQGGMASDYRHYDRWDVSDVHGYSNSSSRSISSPYKHSTSSHSSSSSRHSDMSSRRHFPFEDGYFSAHNRHRFPFLHGDEFYESEDEMHTMAQMQAHYEHAYGVYGVMRGDDMEQGEEEELDMIRDFPPLDLANVMLPDEIPPTLSTTSTSATVPLGWGPVTQAQNNTGSVAITNPSVVAGGQSASTTTPAPPKLQREGTESTKATRSHTRLEDIKSSVEATVTPYLFINVDASASYMRLVLQALEEEEVAESRMAALYAAANTSATVVAARHPPHHNQFDEDDEVPMAIDPQTIVGTALTRLCDYKIPIINARPRTSTSIVTIDPVYRGRHRQYGQNLDVIRAMFALRSIPVHFRGYDSKFDETVPANSIRMMPFRTRSSRPISMNFQNVQSLVSRVTMEQQGFATTSVTNVNNTNIVTSKMRDFAGRNIEFRVRCLWLCSSPGAGLIRYVVPSNTTVRDVVIDFCKNMFIEIGQVRLARINMLHAVRYALQRRTHPPSSTLFATDGLFSREDFTVNSSPGVQHLDLNAKVCDLQIKEGEMLDIIYTGGR